jgi:hypothetical protein
MIPDPYTVSTSKRVYTVTDDLTTHWQMIVSGQVLVGAPGKPPKVYQIKVDHADVYVKIASDGFFALAAQVERIFPDLGTTAYDLTITVQAARQPPVVQIIHLPAGSSLPLDHLKIHL